MAHPYWHTVDPNLPLSEMLNETLLFYGTGSRAVVAQARHTSSKDLEIDRVDTGLFYTTLPSLTGEAWLTPSDTATLREVGQLLGFSQPTIMAIPPVQRPKWYDLFNRKPARIATAGSLHIDGSNLLEYARARQRGERPETKVRQERRDTFLERGRAVVDEYASLKLDIAYRIENSALFDASVPTTHAFEVAMVRWNTEAEITDQPALAELAAELEIAYSVARDHAETVGFGHLPGAKEADARRAAKAARLAERATNDGERRAAQEQVVRILESLALHYLPTAEARRKAIGH